MTQGSGLACRAGMEYLSRPHGNTRSKAEVRRLCPCGVLVSFTGGDGPHLL